MPVVNYQDKLWAKPNPNRVILRRAAWVHYGHVDMEKVRILSISLFDMANMQKKI
jgi:hypothetical protein